MKKVRVVIGANFGDEGKGLITDTYAREAKAEGGRSIVVLSNGGAQRGHTVELLNGIRHVFHHFGSGTYRGADTYFPKEYILNPMVFMDEYQVLADEGYTPLVYINGECMISTPFDMMINQILEEHRDAARHGSCGLGIWETVVRDGVRVREFYELGRDGMKKYLEDIRDNYLPKRLADNGLAEIPKHWEKAVYAEYIIDKYLDDFYAMYQIANGFVPDAILYNYDTIIFENGQGLLLDWDMKKEYGNNVTASYTGLKNPANLINTLWPCEGEDKGRVRDDIEVEVCYVTRTYMTRHGAGRFDTECPKEEINPDMVDMTNVPNPHQGSIRYGKLDVGELLERCEGDFARFPIPGAEMRLAVTHLNEYPLSDEYMKYFKYQSDTAKN